MSHVVFYFLFCYNKSNKKTPLILKTTTEHATTQACVCVRVCLCVCVYHRWAECRHQAQTSSICPYSTAVYKAQTSNITTKLESLITTLFAITVIIYSATCALCKSEHQGMPVFVCGLCVCARAHVVTDKNTQQQLGPTFEGLPSTHGSSSWRYTVTLRLVSKRWGWRVGLNSCTQVFATNEMWIITFVIFCYSVS